MQNHNHSRTQDTNHQNNSNKTQNQIYNQHYDHGHDQERNHDLSDRQIQNEIQKDIHIHNKPQRRNQQHHRQPTIAITDDIEI